MTPPGSMRYDAKRDANESGIILALEKIGCSVAQLTGKAGLLDLLVALRGQTMLQEVKTNERDLNQHQKDFTRTWQGHWAVVRTEEEAIEAILSYCRG